MANYYKESSKTWMMDHKGSDIFCTEHGLKIGIRVRFIRHTTDDYESHPREAGVIPKVVWRAMSNSEYDFFLFKVIARSLNMEFGGYPKCQLNRELVSIR
ncbi:MAG: hypothetical protein ABIB04_04180 [Patescibacteria group bacterium]